MPRSKQLLLSIILGYVVQNAASLAPRNEVKLKTLNYYEMEILVVFKATLF